MARLDVIRTHKFSTEELIETSNYVAEKTGDDWVSYQSIKNHNENLGFPGCSKFKKVVGFLFIDHPYIGFFCAIVVPALLLLPLGVLGTAFGAFIGFVAGSFIFPALFTDCKICKSLKSCNQVYSYALTTDEHTEQRRQQNGSYINVRVRKELAFVVLECKKCKGRKIEIILCTKEKTL
ncbi:MAG: hypothetical protein IKC34_03910 [Clostridia bacterium]|nr:hypothetical protein [Clostridia bacterium]